MTSVDTGVQCVPYEIGPGFYILLEAGAWYHQGKAEDFASDRSANESVRSPIQVWSDVWNQIAMGDSEIYGDSHRQLHDRFDTRRLADRLEGTLVHDSLSTDEQAFIAARDMFFLATVDARGYANCSYKGGEPGFVRAIDAHTIAFPNYDGNGMYLSMGNVLDASQVGILFIDFENQTRMRFNGTASIDLNDPLMGDFPEAQFIVRVRAREIFANCPRYIHKMKVIEHSRFVPRSGIVTPIPNWKTSEWAADALPENDPARDPKREIL